MLPELRDLYEPLEQRKAEFLTRLLALDEEERRAAPAPGAWSPHQVLLHLLYVEGLSAGPEVALPPDNTERPRPGIGLMTKLLAATMRAAIRLPAPDSASPPDEPGVSCEEVAARWTARREDLRRRLEAVTDADRPFARHPIVGPLTARQVLNLCESHLVYHLKRFPAPPRK
jgi:Protein of unknown function (DUF1569).